MAEIEVLKSHTHHIDSDYIDKKSQARPGIKVFPDKLYVITTISNPVRYRSRYELYRAFEEHMKDSGAVLYTVEMAFGDRRYECTEADDPRDIRLRSAFELWHKENMINIGISRLPPNWKYVAWIDADTLFTRPDWCQETLHQLQHYQIVQLFSQAQDIGPNYEALNIFDSFAHSYREGRPLPYDRHGHFYPYFKGGDKWKWHSGYAWAARREAIDHLGGLMDYAILGSADHNMAAALVGCVEKSLDHRVHPNLLKRMKIWQERADRLVRRNIGLVEGLLIHYWHGSKVNRGYVDRWKILVENQYNPECDIKRDWQGLYQLVDNGTPRSIKLRDGIRRYFRQRREDSIDID